MGGVSGTIDIMLKSLMLLKCLWPSQSFDHLACLIWGLERARVELLERGGRDYGRSGCRKRLLQRCLLGLTVLPLQSRCRRR